LYCSREKGSNPVKSLNLLINNVQLYVTFLFTIVTSLSRIRSMAGKHDEEDEAILSKLPPKLLQKLMPFQKKGVVFAVKKNGR